MTNLQDKRIIITGAAGGIAHALIDIVLAGGGQLALIDYDATQLDSIYDTYSSAQAAHLHRIYGDVSCATACDAATSEACERLGGIDGLVNCAAILLPDDGLPHCTPPATWEATLATNLSGTFLMCRAILPHMLANGGGSIVNMSSIVAHLGSAHAQIAYTTAKGGIEAMTREIAVAYAQNNIRANNVAPGPVKTARTQHYFDNATKWAARRAHIPMQRLGAPSEIAEVIAFLLSDASAYVSGSTYFVDGGMRVAYLTDVPDGDGA